MARNARAQIPRGQRLVSPKAPHVTISESDGVRYLHFGTEWVQGAMRIARPFKLELEYQQQMMAPLLFVEPKRVCILGLGAAALVKACWRASPQAEIEVVEISAEVVQTAQQWFKLPEERVSVTVADAAEYVAHPRRRATADLLQVDLYDAAARGPVCDEPGFYRDCRRLLSSKGVAAFNLFGRSYQPSFARIHEAFEGRAVALPEAEAGNRIVLGFAGARRIPFAQLYERAADIADRLRLPARRWVSGLKPQHGIGNDFVI
jgi:spermidine synthase